MKTKRLACAALLLAGSTFVFAAPSSAQAPPHGHPPGGHGGPPPGGHPGGRPHFAFAHRDFAHFTPAEHNNWVGGSWHHGWHNGRLGWWWGVGGAWYFYNAPIYPYPGYVSDYYVDQDYGAPGQYWYYCSSPPGYYPYVQNCSVPWQPVSPAPPPGAGYGPPPGAYNDGGGQPPPGAESGPGPYNQPPPGYQGQGPGDQPPPGYQDQGPDDQPPPGYPPGPGNGPPNQPPPPSGYNGPNGPN